MENTNPTDPTERERILYELGSDGTFEFENGESLRINRSMLAVHSKYFMNAFFGPSPKASMKITDFDRDTFKTFLDCLLGVKHYTNLDALLIYPIAHHYQVRESLEKCIAALNPIQMNENVCLTLNLALFYECNELVDKVTNYIKYFVGVIELLGNKRYRCLLEPDSVCKLLEGMGLHSFVGELLYEWGKDYLEAHNKFVDINSFLKEKGISSKIQECNFESVQCIFDFFETTNCTLFDHKDVFRCWNSRILESKEKFPHKSKWFKLDSQKINETIEFANSFTTSCNVTLQIFANKVFSDTPYQIYYPISTTVQYTFRTISIRIQSSTRWYPGSAHLTHSPFSSNTIENKLTSFVAFPEEPAASISIDVNADQLIEIQSVDITYDFADLPRPRILKTSLSDHFANAGELYFTRDILILQDKRK